MAEPITDPAALRHAALDAIRANPQDWDQSMWRCDSGMCFAGYVAALAGGVFPYDPDDGALASLTTSPGEAVSHATIVVAPDGVSYSIPMFAAKMLDLDIVQASVLFKGENEFDDLEELVGALDSGVALEHRDDDDPADAFGSL